MEISGDMEIGSKALTCSHVNGFPEITLLDGTPDGERKTNLL